MVLRMVVAHVFASIPVVSRDAATSWYERLFGRQPDLVPNDDEAAWRLTESAWVYVIADAARAGSALHTLLVDDLAAFVAGADERGISTGPVVTMANGVRTAWVADPDGNRIQVAQPPAP